MTESMLLVVTGASKGLGEAIAYSFGKEPTSRLEVHLVARSSELLKTVATNLREQSKKTESVEVVCHEADLSALDTLDQTFDRIFQNVNLALFETVIFVNNAGSIGFLGPCHESPSVQDMKKSVDLNVTSCLWLSSRFARLIMESKITTNKATLINISSLLAEEAFPTMGIYAAGKAARDHYHATMANEISSDTLKILNYAPGPLETDMVTEIRSAPKLDKGLRPGFEKKLIEPLDSAAKLTKLVLKGEYQSGAHVDYYDLPDATSSK